MVVSAVCWKDTGCGDLQPMGWGRNMFWGFELG